MGKENIDGLFALEALDEEVEDVKDDSVVIGKIQVAMGVNFSEEQLKVIRHSGKPLNVLSCAGSGKSTVLIAKMFYREMQDGVKPVNMLGITFNRDAMTELEERYKKVRKKLGLKRSSTPTFKTFHSLFYMLLKSIKGYSKYKVASEGGYIFPLMKYIKSDGNRENLDILRDMLSHRGTMINLGQSSDGIEGATYEDVLFAEENYRTVIEKYNGMKENKKELDFDDMLVYLHQELTVKGNEEARESFRSVFKDVYIDEYQDISKIQMEIMDDLLDDTSRLVTIGDDDQSIYGFRGSDPAFIREFVYRYPNAERLYLGDNYRCKGDILNPVISSINNNKVRVEKEIRAFNEGGKVEVIPVQKSPGELASHIKERTEGLYGDDFDDIGILVRLNSQRMLIADILAEEGVQVDIGNMNYSLRTNKVYKTIMGIVEAIKEEDNDKFGNFCRPMLPSVHYTVFEKYKKNKRSNWYEDMVKSGMHGVPQYTIKYIEQIKKTNNMRNAIGFVWKMVEGYYRELAKKGYGSFAKVLEVFRHLFTISQGLTIKQFMKSEYIKESFLNLYCNSGNAVQINTLHSVKGLEYDTVYLIGLDNSVFPNEARIEGLKERKGEESAQEYIEEERRLFYVGWTRAKNSLVVSYKESDPSMFLSEVSGLTLPGVNSISQPEE